MTRAEAVQTVRAAQGLTDLAPSDWSYDQRVSYNQALAALIAQNASSFPPQEVEVARAIQAETVSPLADTSVSADLGAFGSAFLDNVEKAGDSVADVGRGALAGISIAGMAIPLLVVVGVGLVIWVGFGKAQQIRAS